MEKILVIDDDAMLRDVIAQVLETHGYVVIQAENGKAGLDLAQKHVPRLIICDVSMPTYDGFWTIGEVRKNPAIASIPFVFLTGQEERTHVRQGMDLGADDYITKPVTSKELIAAINSRLEKHDAVMREANKKLEELRLSVTLSLPHEMRTPLFGILGFTEILKSDPGSLTPDEVREMGESIHHSAKRLHHVLENFLVYAQLEMMASDPQRTQTLRSIHSSGVLARIEGIALEAAQRYDRVADLSIEGEDASVGMSAEYLSKICTEIIDNAFKFSPGGSPVTVSTGINEGWFRIAICDSGVGMSQEQIANVGAYMQFERRIREQQGAGLGLAIARRLVQLHDGTMTMESDPGRLTRMVIEIPIGSSTAEPA